jgi:hypothetical protein
MARLEFTAEVGDPDSGDVVMMIGLNVPTFLTFSMVPGNPANFTLAGDILASHRGDYGIRVAAFDSTGNGASGFVDLRIIPEPGSIGLLVCGALVALQRRRGK